MKYTGHCIWIILVVCRMAATEFQQADFIQITKGTRPTNGRSISVVSVGTSIRCGVMCLSNPSCTSFTIRKATSLQVSCDLRDQRDVNETVLLDDANARYFTKRECYSRPCQNGGTCTEGLDGYLCQCVSGFTGKYCETNVDECASNPCQNGATCSDGVNGFTCNCPACYTETLCDQVVHCDCAMIQMTAPNSSSGVYNVTPSGGSTIEVYCDMDTDGGGWLILQQRQNGSIDFYQDWEAYAAGFGVVNEEYWLGNRNVHLLSQQKSYSLRVDLGDWAANHKYAQYSSFAIASEADKFRLSLGTYTGDAGDSLSYHRGWPFSTRDQDNDYSDTVDCAEAYHAAWWYKNCRYSNLNGQYYHSGPSSPDRGVNWYYWLGYSYSLKTTIMMIRPAN